MPIYNLCIHDLVKQQNQNSVAGLTLFNPELKDCDGDYAAIHNKCDNKKCLDIDEYRSNTIVRVRCGLKSLKIGNFYIQNALKRTHERREWVKRVWKNVNVNSESLWFPFTEYYTCPASLTKHPSISEKLDGGKWMCGYEELSQKPKCVVYSFGSKGEYDFEIETHNVAKNCEIHTFDCTYKPRNDLPSFIKYHSLCLSDSKVNPDNIGPMKNLKQIYTMLQHKHVDVLKIDIEGHEWSIVDEIGAGLPFSIGQLSMEMHTRYVHRSGIDKPMSAPMMDSYFTKLESRNLFLSVTEPVCTSCKNHKETLWLNASHWN